MYVQYISNDVCDDYATALVRKKCILYQTPKLSFRIVQLSLFNRERRVVGKALRNTPYLSDFIVAFNLRFTASVRSTVSALSCPHSVPCLWFVMPPQAVWKKLCRKLSWVTAGRHSVEGKTNIGSAAFQNRYTSVLRFFPTFKKRISE
jgi:hypothetical protein